MKKVFSLLLALCLLATISVACALTAGAATEDDEIIVTVGSEYSYNQQTGDGLKTWFKSNYSPDGLWQYQWYSVDKGTFQDMVYVMSGGYFAWSEGDTLSSDPGPLAYTRVRNFGKNFHPGNQTEVCKTFICPSSGTIHVVTDLARDGDFTAESVGTPSTFRAVLGNDDVVYPTSGDNMSLTSKSTVTVEFDVEVLKGQKLHFCIGSAGDRSGDAVNMENYVTYTAISDAAPTTETEEGYSIPTGTVIDIPTLTDTGSGTSASNTDGGMSTGAIVAIVIAAVAVVGIAVAVIVIVKKKKS